MRRTARAPVSPGDAIGQSMEIGEVGRDVAPGRRPVTHGTKVEERTSAELVHRAASGSHVMSAAAPMRSLRLSHLALPPAGRLRSLADVADYLGVSIRTVRRLIERGELQAHRVGRSLRIQDANLAAYVAASIEHQ